MELRNTSTPQASPQEVARKIAALHGAEPREITAVKMIGTQEVEKFFAQMREGQRDAQKTILVLD